VWEPLRGKAGGHGLTNYRFVAAILFLMFVILCLLFR
jgi:hypothetical protein